SWRRLVAPEGKLYFYCPELMLYTNTYIPDALAALGELEGKAKSLRKSLPEERQNTSELVLELLPDNVWGYYFADTAARMVFWNHAIDLADIIQSNPRFVVSDNHLGMSFQFS
ncbi:uncharacterized protein PHACADRAFT_71630, partial [Phanerochaete carnosa HHB-10118-sp]